jgi:hypothetical protein
VEGCERNRGIMGCKGEWVRGCSVSGTEAKGRGYRGKLGEGAGKGLTVVGGRAKGLQGRVGGGGAG